MTRKLIYYSAQILFIVSAVASIFGIVALISDFSVGFLFDVIDMILGAILLLLLMKLLRGRW